MKITDKLIEKYRANITSWDWPGIKAEAKTNTYPDYDNDNIIGRALLGSIINLYPSHKIYALWTTNQTRRDEIRDGIFIEALEAIAEDHGMWIDEFNEDLFATMVIEE